MFESYIKAKSRILHESVVLGINKKHSRGAVYTPEHISKYMVYLLVRDYMYQQDKLTEAQDALLKSVYLDQTLETCSSYQVSHKTHNDLKHILEMLKPLSIMDLACGTGLLLLAYLELHMMLLMLLKASKADLLENLGHIIEGQLYAYDINEEATKHFKETLQILMRCLNATYCFKQDHIQNGNSLLLDISIKVDLMIGNPPYIGEKGNLDLFEVIKASDFGKKYYEGKMDYFYFFIYKAHQHLKANGSLCYLTSNYFFTADGATNLRNFIKNEFNFSQVLNFNDESIFKDKKLHACIYTLSLKKQAEIQLLDAKLNLKKRLSASDVYLSSKTFHFISDEIVTQILAKIEKRFRTQLGADFDVKQGIVSGADRFNGFPVFVYKENELSEIPQSLRKEMKPFFKNSAIKHFEHDEQTPFYVLYSHKHLKQVEAISLLLEPYRDKLMLRREVINGVRQWYELTWPREVTMFERPKIVVPQRGKSNYFAYSEGVFHASADVYYIFEKANLDSEEEKLQSLKGLTAFLNSYVILMYLYYKGKRKGEALELYATPLKLMPYEPSLLKGLSDLYDLKCALSDKLDAINKVLYAFLDLNPEECDWLNKFGRKFL
ncbi:Eco57I restriction-modification methylase domain-containing protein [Fusibacter sp. 3D3]|uniref:Eco57I restriction-modification methylase domain-containing protein n=1 Tax=Fusibacter sp. 3D3 TaxID=1048380 RepID=UPI0008535F78|nr:N-6 DNA methylase [Fusibacter sp. 3D3]GAU77452.1 hypothetical protein F3D3_2081 [Fusibacter sp. 3D3]